MFLRVMKTQGRAHTKMRKRGWRAATILRQGFEHLGWLAPQMNAEAVEREARCVRVPGNFSANEDA